MSPSSANLHEFIPPAFVGPIHQKSIAFDEIRSAEIEYAEKRIIVEVVDRCFRWFDEPGPDLPVS